MDEKIFQNSVRWKQNKTKRSVQKMFGKLKVVKRKVSTNTLASTHKNALKNCLFFVRQEINFSECFNRIDSSIRKHNSR